MVVVVKLEGLFEGSKFLFSFGISGTTSSIVKVGYDQSSEDANNGDNHEEFD